LSSCPIILVPYIRPSHFIVEKILTSLFILSLFFFLFFHLLWFNFYLLFLLWIKFLSTIEVGSVWLMAVLVYCQSCDVVYDFWRVKILDDNSSFGKGQLCHSVAHDLLILFGLIDLAEIGFLMLIKLIMLLGSFKRIEIFVFYFLKMFIPFSWVLVILHRFLL